ncbi:aminoglycoside phosphotransferase family protein [Bacillus sp. AFS017336]|uniref:aminoglycoside phosphotransferase family protein n=1 Tax=Bacillus sp. AFS017336 TaxID=2033489 RepID=UPI000BF19B55|nr:aminoglycoside phosphotransferase family protein [Bacillus sp. AFS017336]PEK98824.1 aminoglycoside phosphotransferase [Bacillus sp. AFS017336]
MYIEAIINDLSEMGLFHKRDLKYIRLTGGTTSSIYLLIYSNIDAKYIVKLNDPQVLESESFFLNFYHKVNLLPNLLFVEKSFNYLVYPFIQGNTNYDRDNKKNLLKSLVEQLINHYEPYPNAPGWGWADDLTYSWTNFLLSRITEANKILDSHLLKKDHNLILSIVNNTNRMIIQGDPFLIHGDCGVHNFIFNKGKLNGVIDPTPVFGDPLYDLIYAFCSSPDNLTKEILYYAASQLKFLQNTDSRYLFEEVLVGLYLRLATCIKYHPEDLNEYLVAWDYWKKLVRST